MQTRNQNQSSQVQGSLECIFGKSEQWVESSSGCSRLWLLIGNSFVGHRNVLFGTFSHLDTIEHLILVQAQNDSLIDDFIHANYDTVEIILNGFLVILFGAYQGQDVTDAVDDVLHEYKILLVFAQQKNVQFIHNLK